MGHSVICFLVPHHKLNFCDQCVAKLTKFKGGGYNTPY